MKFPFIFIALFTFLIFNSTGNAQTPDASIEVKKADFRGQDSGNAIIAGLSASEEDVIVVLIRGGSDKLINKIEDNMKTIIRNGYVRIGLILSDLFPDEKDASVAVFSDGSTYAVINKAEEDTYNDWALYNLVRDAYEENIKPKLKSTVDSNN